MHGTAAKFAHNSSFILALELDPPPLTLLPWHILDHIGSRISHSTMFMRQSRTASVTTCKWITNAQKHAEAKKHILWERRVLFIIIVFLRCEDFHPLRGVIRFSWWLFNANELLSRGADLYFLLLARMPQGCGFLGLQWCKYRKINMCLCNVIDRVADFLREQRGYSYNKYGMVRMHALNHEWTTQTMQVYACYN